jgi:uncharacterized membrane protein
VSDLVVIVYPSQEKAEQVRQRLLQLQQEYLIELEDAVIATKTQDGYVRLDQLISPTAIGAATGSLWGLLIGAVFLTPVMVASAGAAGAALGAVAGAGLGAATGAISGALSDLGLDDKFIEQLAESLQPGNSALFLLVRRMTTDKVLEALKGTGGTVLKTSFDHRQEQALRDAIAAAAAASAAGEPQSTGTRVSEPTAVPA